MDAAANEVSALDLMFPMCPSCYHPKLMVQGLSISNHVYHSLLNFRAVAACWEMGLLESLLSLSTYGREEHH